MRIVIMCLTALILSAGCDDSKFNGDNDKSEVQPYGMGDSLSFRAEVNDQSINGEVIVTGSVLNNKIPITIDSRSAKDVIRVSIKNKQFDYFKTLKKVSIDDGLYQNYIPMQVLGLVINWRQS